jgi:putative sigma-54 modulation protein
MRIDFKFRHSPQSADLIAYVSERVSKLEKFALKPLRMEVTFTAEKSIMRVDIHIRSQDVEMHARGESEDYFTGVDLALEKIARQMERKKSRVQAHKGKKLKAPKVPKVS